MPRRADTGIPRRNEPEQAQSSDYRPLQWLALSGSIAYVGILDTIMGKWVSQIDMEKWENQIDFA
jgi:hypothetical protein